MKLTGTKIELHLHDHFISHNEKLEIEIEIDVNRFFLTKAVISLLLFFVLNTMNRLNTFMFIFLFKLEHIVPLL